MNKIIQIILAATIILPFGNVVAQEKQEFKPGGKIGGYAFGDYYFKQHADSAKRGSQQYSGMAQNANSFEFRRIYLGYDYNISEKFSTEFLLSYEGQTLSDAATRSIFVKAANVKWKGFLPKNDMVIGLQSTPAFAFITDKVWEFRSIEKSLADMRRLSTAVDAGIGLQGRLDSAGNFGYNLLAANGSGAKIESDKFKKFYGDVYAKFMDKKLIVDLYADYERVQLSPYHKSKMAMKLFIGYQTEKFALGIEAYQQAQENFSIYTDTALLNGDTVNASVFGAGIFVRGAIVKGKLAFFVRTDVYDPDSEFNKNYVYSASYSAYNTEIFATAGIDFTPTKNVHIIPNVWYNSYQSRMKNASGKMKADYDLVPRITVHYLFK